MRKNTLLLALLAPLALGLSSCVYDIDPGHRGGGYSTVSSIGYGYSPSRYSYGSYGYPWGIGGGYRHRYYCDRCRSHSCRGHHDDHHHDHKKKSSSSDLKHRENSYRIAGGSTGSKKKPTGYHSIGWYESRGYDTSHLRLEDERGNRYGSSRSSSSKSRSSSSSSRSSSSSKSSSGGGSKSSSSKSSSSKSGGSSSKSSSSKSGSSGRTQSRSSGSKGRSRGQ